MTLRLDDCEHCACVTPVGGYTRASAIAALDEGSLGCWNCSEDDDDMSHHGCVVLYDDDVVVLDRRCLRRGSALTLKP